MPERYERLRRKLAGVKASEIERDLPLAWLDTWSASLVDQDQM